MSRDLDSPKQRPPTHPGSVGSLASVIPSPRRQRMRREMIQAETGRCGDFKLMMGSGLCPALAPCIRIVPRPTYGACVRDQNGFPFSTALFDDAAKPSDTESIVRRSHSSVPAAVPKVPQGTATISAGCHPTKAEVAAFPNTAWPSQA